MFRDHLPPIKSDPLFVTPPLTPIAATPDMDHSVLAALRSPRRLWIELLAGLAVALALIPKRSRFRFSLA